MLKLGLTLGKAKVTNSESSTLLNGTHLIGSTSRGSCMIGTNMSGTRALHQKSIELSGLTRKSPIAKTKNLIGALLCHGARTRRVAKAPVTVRLRVFTPQGSRAVQFGYK